MSPISPSKFTLDPRSRLKGIETLEGTNLYFNNLFSALDPRSRLKGIETQHLHRDRRKRTGPLDPRSRLKGIETKRYTTSLGSKVMVLWIRVPV